MRSLFLIALFALCASCSSDGGGGTEADARDASDDFADSAEQPDIVEQGDTIEADVGASDVTDDPEAPELILSGLLAVEGLTNVLSMFVEWDTSEPADTRLAVTCDDGFDQHFESDTATRHRVFVMGLTAGAACELTAESQTPDGRTVTESAEYTVSALPGHLPEVTVEAPHPGDIRPGWTAVSLSEGRTTLTVVMFDAEGRYRWYYVVSTGRPGGGSPVSMVDDLIVIGGSTGVPARIVTLEGELVWQAPFSSHHETLFVENQYVYALIDDAECPQEDVHETTPLIRWDIIDDDLDRSWLLCDHYEPPVSFPDWAHSNSIDLFPDGEAFVHSARKQNALFRIDHETGEVDWVLGFGGRPMDGWNGDFAMAEEDRFYQQHSPQILESGNILIFDNGSCAGCGGTPARGWSRAIEIAYDTTTWEAEVVWEFRADPDIYSRAWGDAERIDNGNTLVTFGRAETTTNATETFEVRPDGEVAWRLTLPDDWGTYRATRVDASFGYVIEE